MENTREEIKKELTLLLLRKNEIEIELADLNNQIKAKRNELFEVSLAQKYEEMERRNKK